MTLKRSINDVDSQSHSTSSRGNGFNPKRQKQDGASHHKTKEERLGFAKKRIRSIKRLLRRYTDLPANVHNDLQRELAALEATVADRVFRKKRSAMISKYHMVRFFERKKATRLIKQIKRKMELNADDENENENEELKRQLHIAEVDEAYTIYHPHIEPYISLYGGLKADSKEQEKGESGDEEAQQTSTARIALHSERPPMWSVVEKTMEQGIVALEELRERPKSDFSVSTTKSSRASSKSSQNRMDKTPEKASSCNAVKDKNDDNNDKKVVTNRSHQTGEAAQLNRRERRRLMREAAAEKKSDEEEEGGGFFEGL